MKSDFLKTVTLGEISVDKKGSYGIAASAVDYSAELPTYIRITDISDDGFLIKDELKSVDDSRSPKYVLEPNDIVFARTGNSTGKSYFYDGTDGELVYAGFLIKFSLDSDKVNPRYIRYYTLSHKYLGWVKSFSTGSTRANINANMYKNMEIELPNRNYQDFVVSVLSSFENKIKHNEAIIKNFEELAETLFKHWFVDFEFPNKNNEQYKSSGGKMFESELGMIPEGWQVKSLSEIADFQNGLAMQKHRAKDGEVTLPVLKIKELRQGFTNSDSDRCSVNIKKSVKVFNGDVIFSWSASLLVKLWIGGNAGLNQHLFKVTSDDYPKWFYYMWTKHYLDEFNAIAKDKATTMGHIKRSHLNESKVIIPTDKKLEELTKIISPIINKKIKLAEENKSLEELRDTLLPKLLSGEIELPDTVEVTDDVPIS